MAYYAKHTGTTTIGGSAYLIAFATFYGPFVTTDAVANRIDSVSGGSPDMDEWEVWDVDDEFPIPDQQWRKD